MSRYALVLAVLVALCTAEQVDVNKYSKNANDFNSTEFKRQARNIEGRLAGGSDVSATPPNWVVAIFEGTNYIGIGGIVNRYWCATYSKNIAGKTATALTAYEGVGDTSAPGSAVLHTGTMLKIHEAVDTADPPVVNAIGILKVCPPWKNTITLPPAKTGDALAWAEGTDAKFYNYDNKKLMQAGKKTGEACECELVIPFDKTKNLCLEQNNMVNNNDGKSVGSLVYISSTFAGISVVASSTTGESYLDLAKYNSWIKTNAIIL